LTTKFMLRHRVLGCFLTTGKTPLPEWGFKQGEVFCDQSPRRSNKASGNWNSIWNIEYHRNHRRKSCNRVLTSFLFESRSPAQLTPPPLSLLILNTCYSSGTRVHSVQIKLLAGLYTRQRRYDGIQQRTHPGSRQE
jgi:hypothetical protein